MAQRNLTVRQATRVITRRNRLVEEAEAIRTRRPRWNLRSESRFQYHLFVAAAPINREEWAKFVQELLDEEAAPLTDGGRPRVHGAKTRFAGKAKLKTARTVDTWLRREVDVKESSVRDVAIGYGRNPVDVMVRVGALPVDPRTVDEVVDDEIGIVLDSDLDDETKAALIKELEAWRDEDRAMQAQLAERDKRRRIASLRERIQQAKA